MKMKQENVTHNKEKNKPTDNTNVENNRQVL